MIAEHSEQTRLLQRQGEYRERAGIRGLAALPHFGRGLRQWPMLCLAAFVLLLAPLPGAALQHVVLQLKWKHQFQFAGYYAALEKGYYREAGLDVEIREPVDNTTPVDNVLDGTADFGIGASDLALYRTQGKPIVVLACIIQHSPLVLITNDKIKSVQELEGKRVMLLPHETELFAFLAGSGVHREKIVAVPHSFNMDALVSGKVDAMSGYSSDEIFDLKAANFPYHQFTPRSIGIDFYGDALFTSENLLKKNPKLVAAFREASLRGWRYALTHEDELIDLIIAKYTRRHGPEHLRFEAAETTRLMQPDLVEVGEMNPLRWQKIADTYADLGLTTSDFDLDAFIYDPRPIRLPVWFDTSVAATVLILALFGFLVWRFARLNQSLQTALGQRNQALTELRDSEEQLRVVLDTAPVAVITWTEGFIVTGWNRAAQRTFGWSRDEALGKNFFDFLVPNPEAPGVREIITSALYSELIAESVNQNLTKDGRTILCAWSNAMFHDTAGTPAGVISIALDITEKARAEESLQAANAGLKFRLEEIQLLQSKLQELAIRDGLTGLYNRRYLDETLEREVARARREHQPLSLLMIDVDHFKLLNDSHGHRAGDRVLRMLAELLQADTRAEDVACRYGGEEFLVLLPGMPLEKALERAEAWRHDIESTTVSFEGKQLGVTASFGVACYPEHGSDPDHLTSAADSALYAAKNAGRNRVHCPPTSPRIEPC